jgi:UDP-3-O-[3-hydroxymyristoyl] glucosamine N-acyltransferase
MRTLGDIARLLEVGAPAGYEGVAIGGLAMLSEAGPGDLSFLGSDKYLRAFRASKAAAFLVGRRVKLPGDHGRAVLVVEDADLAMAKVSEAFAPPVPRPAVGIDPAARVDATASVGRDVRVGHNVVIGAGARVGDRTVLHANVFVGDRTVVGADCELFPNVVVRERCTLGDRVVIHAGSVLGSDGFGYRWDGQRHAKVPQIGTVVVEDDVEIGSCVCIDRAKFGATRVGRGTKIDNLVQVAHNVVTGPHCLIIGQAGMAGSVTLGAGVILAGQCAVKDHVTMGDRSILGPCSGLLDDVEPGQMVSGIPAVPHRQRLREEAALRHLPELRVQVRKMQEELDALRKQLPGAAAGGEG